MLHAGVLKKFGLYGLIRIALPLLPQAAQSWAHVIAWLCVGNILYVGWVAMRQRDLNLLIGNSSVAHMGFIFLGIASLNLIGVTGAVLIMVAHGFLAALSFALSGYIYQQTGTLKISELGGLCRKLPFIGTALLMAAMAGCGLPGFANFVGEVTVFFGAWKSFPTVTAIALWGALVIGGIYMTRAIRNVLHGPLPEKWNSLSDATNTWRKLPYALLLVSLLVFGFVPKLLTDKINPDAQKIVALATTGKNADVVTTPSSSGRESVPILWLKSEPTHIGCCEIRMNSSLIMLEVSVIGIGLVLMLAELFVPAGRRRFIGYAAIVALGVLLVASLSGSGSCGQFGTAFNGMFVNDGFPCSSNNFSSSRRFSCCSWRRNFPTASPKAASRNTTHSSFLPWRACCLPLPRMILRCCSSPSNSSPLHFMYSSVFNAANFNRWKRA